MNNCSMYVCQFLSMDENEKHEHILKVFTLFKVGDERPIGRIDYFPLGMSVERNKYADWKDFIEYPYGGIILIERTSFLNANGTYTRFIDYENDRDDRDRTLVNANWSRKISRNFYEDYNINLHYFTRRASVDTWQFNQISNQCFRSFMNAKPCRIMEFQDCNPLPDCVMTVERFRERLLSLGDRECFSGTSIYGILITIE